MSGKGGGTPRQARTASSTFPLGSGKVRQLQRAGCAVGAAIDHAEPEDSAAFTYLKLQAQVLHFVFSRAYLSLGVPQDFSAVGRARPDAVKRRTWFEALWRRGRAVRTLVFCLSVDPSACCLGEFDSAMHFCPFEVWGVPGRGWALKLDPIGERTAQLLYLYAI